MPLGILLEKNFVLHQVLGMFTLASMKKKIIFGSVILWIRRKKPTRQVLFVQDSIHYQAELWLHALLMVMYQ